MVVIYQSQFRFESEYVNSLIEKTFIISISFPQSLGLFETIENNLKVQKIDI